MIRRPCNHPGCGRLTTSGRCPEHQPPSRHHERGYNTRHWRRLRTLAFAQHPYCAICGSGSDLTAHLRPELAGNHRAATLDDVIVLCRRHHGAVDAPRAKGGRG